MDFTLWALHKNGKMQPLDLEAMRRELAATDHPAPAWVMLGGLLERLDGCPDPQVQGAMAWVEEQLEQAANLAKPPPPPPEPKQPPAALLASFGICAIVGAGTVVHWLWRLVARVL